jgi:hypothetical protein
VADAAFDTSLDSEGFVGAGGNDDDFAGLNGSRALSVIHAGLLGPRPHSQVG